MKTPKLLDIVDVQWDDGVCEMIITLVDKHDSHGSKLPKESRNYHGIMTADKDTDDTRLSDADRSMSFEACQIIRNHGSWRDMIKGSMLELIGAA